MNSQILNTEKSQLLTAQDNMLNAASESKTKLTPAQETEFANASNRITEIDTTLARMAAIEKGKREVSAPTSDAFVPNSSKSKSGKRELSAAYHEAFWNSFAKRGFRNENLSEGTNADGGYLVTVSTDKTIVPLAGLESSMRKLGLVIPTENDILLPAEAVRTVAAQKTESTGTSQTAFGGTSPSFTQVHLSAYMVGVNVPVTFELAQDVPALQAFLPADIQRGICNYEENMFINGSGTAQPQGILNGATAAFTEALSANSTLDLLGALNPMYFGNAKWLMHRKTGIVFRKAQIAANQFQTYWTNVNGQDYLHGFPVEYSYAMPVYAASPLVLGAIAFGDFKAAATIGDRGGSDIRVKILDQVNALQGLIQVLGYRRSDQRIRLAEAVQILTVNG